MLNALGGAYGVRFLSELLKLAGDSSPQGLAFSKVEGLCEFLSDGYRVFAVMDDQLQNLETMLEVVRDPDILFLHTDLLHNSLVQDAPMHHWMPNTSRNEFLFAGSAC
jgi:hypothetical protein